MENSTHFKYQLKFLKISGVWNENKRYRYCAIALHILYFVLFLSNFTLGLLVKTSLKKKLEEIWFAITLTVLLSKFLLIVMKKDQIQGIMKEVETFKKHLNETHEVKAIQGGEKRGRVLMIIFFVVFVIANGFDLFIWQKEPGELPLAQACLGFNWNSSTLTYHICVGFQISTYIFHPYFHAVYFSMMIYFMNFVAVLYELLNYKFENIKHQNYTNDLILNIQLHQIINEHAEKVEEFCKVPILLSTLFNAPVICLEVLNFFGVSINFLNI